MSYNGGMADTITIRTDDETEHALDVLTRIPADGVFENLFKLIDVPGVAGGLLAAAER